MVTKQEELATKEDLGELEGRLTTQIGANAAKIDGNAAKIDANAAKIDVNAAKIDQVEKNLSAKIDANGSKIDSIATSLSRLTSIVLENRERMANKEEMNKRLDRIVTGQDKMIKLYMNLDQERTATKARVDRIDGDVEKNKTKIRELEAKVAR